ncbi:MAG: CoA transferase [Steroidobacteraceae bacterium]|nr:CoA transferase [Steroidobacteraceae bacterium]MBP7015430.1 CoA transferase [Steroidobacteraceae bacterium]
MLPLLQGIRVLDFTTIVLGPYATQTLGDLGADVIKIEPLQGDLFRTVRPGRSRSMGAGFIGFNRNKRSLALDLKRPQSRAVLARLVSSADAVVHNMRPKAAEPLGLDYEQLARIKPDLVYAFAAGYDQSGPNANEPAYDDIVQAAAGVAALNANAQGEPRYLATILCDKVGGLHLAIAVATGLAHRARTGKGCCIETPMFESTVAFLLSEQLGGETFIPALGPTGYDRLAAPNRKPYRTQDGFMAILPYNGRHWAAFLEIIGRTDLAHSPQVQDPMRRSQSVDSLYAIIAEVAPARPTAEWLELLRAADIPCARVNSVGELLQDPHLVATGFFREYDHPTEGRLRAPRSPFRWHHGTETADRHAPRPGGDSRAVLAEAGFEAGEIDRLVADGVIGVDDAAQG